MIKVRAFWSGGNTAGIYKLYILSAWSWKNGQKILRDDWLNPCTKLHDQVIFEHIIYTYPPSETSLKPALTTYCGNYFNISKYPCCKTEPDLNWEFRKLESFIDFLLGYRL